ncbi:MAG: NADH-quinone oxidoreductase subunit H, partial [bacterium]|nr:NADH-quinone oxidoreductase subunit H [bacterium]
MKIVNILVLLFFPFLFLGLINRVKSFWAGRQGPSIFQPLFDFLKLLKKDIIIGQTTSWVFQLSPIIGFSSILIAGLLVPLTGHVSILSFEYNFILFSYIIALGKFFSVIAAMDTGSSFEGMGASREITFSSLVEPGFFILLGSLALFTKSAAFQDIFSLTGQHTSLSCLIITLSVMALYIMLLVESCRVPVDDPNTHLELTMIHEVMILDNSGPDLGFIMYGAGMKMVIIGSLIANIILPVTLKPGYYLL